MRHVFLAVDLDDELKRRIEALIGTLHLRGARVAPASQAHVTVRFLGDVADGALGAVRAAVERASARHPRFPMELAGGGTFGPPGRARVLWVGVRDARPLLALADDVDAELSGLPCAPRDHAFAAHVTIARARGRMHGDLEGLRSLPSLGTMVVERLTLFRSHETGAGSGYQILALAPLA
ncbi:MAG: RNA 2',3'-cyclic phosphodiesterase [Deltaproteobacteria bacterium]|nr:RNA 2',3'-cyclic phosphodiesterase [Deltaproteobacteria bacterium]